MTAIEQLGNEYERTAMTVKSRINERLARLRELRRNGKMLTDDAYVIKSELNMLYREYNDTVTTAAHLKNYYSRDDEKRCIAPIAGQFYVS